MLPRKSAGLKRNQQTISKSYSPVSLIEDNDFVSSWRECNLLLCKGFDLISDDVNATG
jgi:hypothetical protein